MITRQLAALAGVVVLLSCQAKKKSDSHLASDPILVTLGTGALPPTLEETGLFIGSDMRTPGPGVQSYAVQVPLWSDGAQKDRFIYVPKDTAIHFDGAKLDFPVGTVLVKHFRSDKDPSQNIETRVIVLNDDRSWIYGAYVWNDDGSTELLERSRTVKKDGKDYRIPSPKECTTCHRPDSDVLGFVAGQLNHNDQIESLIDLKILDSEARTMLNTPLLADIKDTSLPVETRARTYMHVNCSSCHNPGGPPGANAMDLRLEAVDTKLISLSKIFPGNPEASILFQKISADTSRMPPVSIRPDPMALEIFRAYIEMMPKPQEEPVITEDPPVDTEIPPDVEIPDPGDGAEQSGGLLRMPAGWMQPLRTL